MTIQAVAGEIGQEINQTDRAALLDAMQGIEKRKKVFPPAADSPILRQFFHVGIGIDPQAGQDGPLSQDDLHETPPLGVAGQAPQGRLKSANKSTSSPCGYSNRFSKATDCGASPLSCNRQSTSPGRNQTGSIRRSILRKLTRSE